MTSEFERLVDEWGFLTPVPELVIEHMAQIGVDAFAVFSYLRYRTNKDRHVAWPGYKDMESKTGLRRERIAAALRALEDAGLLVRTKRFGDSTVYRLVRPPDVGGDDSISPPSGQLADVGASPVVRQVDSSSPAVGLQLSARADRIQDLSIQDSLNQESGEKGGFSPPSHDQTPWVQILTLLRRGMDRAEFDTWVQPTELVSLAGDVLTIGAASSFGVERLQSKHREEIEAAAREVLGRPVRVRFIVASKEAA